jgi:hypothetical protein
MNLSVIINSCDKYEFIWNQFVKLFDKYWDYNINVPIYFLTEDKPISHTNFISITNGKLNWTKSVKLALNQINTKYILWLQDDYFLRKTIYKNNLMDYLEFIQYYNVGRFGIHGDSNLYYLNKDSNSSYFRYRQNSLYTISLQASIWNKEFFQSCLHADEESPWQFEIDGTSRLNKTNHKIFVDLQYIPWYQEALKQGQYTKDYFDICKQENI